MFAPTKGCAVKDGMAWILPDSSLHCAPFRIAVRGRRRIIPYFSCFGVFDILNRGLWANIARAPFFVENWRFHAENRLK